MVGVFIPRRGNAYKYHVVGHAVGLAVVHAVDPSFARCAVVVVVVNVASCEHVVFVF